MARPATRSWARHLLNTTRRHLGLLWLVVLIPLIAVFVYSQRDEIGRTGHVLADAALGWVLAVGLLEVVVLGLMAKTYQILLARLGCRVGLRAIIAAYLQGIAVGTVVPLGGATSVVVFVRSLTRRGVPAEDAVFATALNAVVGFGSFILVLVPVLTLLAIQHRLSETLVLAAALVAGLFTLLSTALFFVLRGPRPPEWVRRRTPGALLRFIEQSREQEITPRDLVLPLAISVAVDLSGTAMLLVALKAVGQAASPVPALAGYQIEMLMNVATPAFQGVGVAELSMTVVLQAVGVPLAAALAGTLIYRLWDLWVPFALGLALYSRRRQAPTPGSSEPAGAGHTRDVKRDA